MRNQKRLSKVVAESESAGCRIRFILFCFVFAFCLVPEVSLARDLVDAAQTAQTMFNRIGLAAVGIGVTIGGILFAVGAANLGRLLLLSGFFGACAILGGPSLIQLLARIFGVAA